MTRKFKLVLAAVLCCAVVATLASLALGSGDDHANSATFNDNSPTDALAATGGPFVGLTQATATAREAWGAPTAPILDSRLTDYGTARDLAGIVSTNAGIQPAREVYFIRLSGQFQWDMVPVGEEASTLTEAWAIIDATTGEVLSAGGNK